MGFPYKFWIHINFEYEKKKKKCLFKLKIFDITMSTYVHKLKLSIKYFNLNIKVTSHAEKVSMFTRQISDTRLSLL